MSSERRAWMATVGAGLIWGMVPISLGALGALAGAWLAAHSLTGRPGWDGVRGATLAALAYGLGLLWVVDAWSAFGAESPWLVWGALTLAQAVPMAVIWAVAGAALPAGGRILTVALALGSLEGLGDLIQPLPGLGSVLLASSPWFLWPAVGAGRPALGLALGAWAAAPVRQGVMWLLVWIGVGALWTTIPVAETSGTRVAVIQTDVGAFEARRSSTSDERAARLRRLVDQAQSDGADWVVTPEGAWPGDPGRAGGQRRADFLEAWQGAPPLVLGVEVYDDDLPTNSAWVVEEGALGDRFDKALLVPVAERAVGSWGTTRFRVPETSRHLTVAGVEVTPLICFEDLMPEAVKSAEHAEVIVAMTHDAWVGPGRGAALHLATARLAAVSTGRWLVRSASSGPSAIISPRGELVWSSDWLDGDRAETEGQVAIREIGRRVGRGGGAWLHRPVGLACGLGLLALVGRRLW